MHVLHPYLTAGVSLTISLGITPCLAQSLPDSLPVDIDSLNQDPLEQDPQLDPTSEPGQQDLQLDRSESEFQPNLLNRPTQPEAVTIEATQSLTLQEAIELAEQNNRLLQIAHLQVEVLETIQQEAESTLLPRLFVGANLTYQSLEEVEFVNRQIENSEAELKDFIRDRISALVPSRFPPLTEREIELLNNFANQAIDAIIDSTRVLDLTQSTSLPLSATVGVAYDLDIWGGRSAAVQAARRQVEVGNLEVQLRREDIHLLVKEAYYDLQEADQLVRISEAALDNALEILSDAQALQTGGVGTQLDVQRTLVLVADTRQALETASTLQKNARRRLVERLGISENTEITAADPIEIAGTWDLSLEESIVNAYENRLELDQLLLEREVSQRQEQVVRAINRPQLSLFARYSVLNVLDAPFNPGFVDGYGVGATLLWNFYDGGATNARVNREQINQQIIENQFAEARDQIRLQVEENYNLLQANRANIETASLALEVAQEVLRKSTLGFNAGVTTQLEVTTAQTDLTRAETNLVRSILNYNRALAALQRVVNPPVSGET